MQKGFDVDVRRKQWVLDTGISSRRDEVLLDLETPPPGLLAAAQRLQGAFGGAQTVPSKAAPRAPAPDPPAAKAPPAAEPRLVTGRRLLFAYVGIFALMVLGTPAFVNHGPGAPLAVVCCVAPLLLPVVAAHLLLLALDGLRAAAACGAAALAGGVPLAVLLAHGLGVAQVHWGAHACAALLALAYTLSLPGAAFPASVTALGVTALGAAAVELTRGGGPEAPTVAFAAEIATCALFAVWSLLRYLDRALLVSP
jgi:hypothetical protein